MKSWKVLGLAGLAGVAVAGVAVARKNRTWTEASPTELRDKLHERLNSTDAASRDDRPPPES